MKKLFLLVNIIMLSLITYAQSVDEIRPSVNAKQFLSAASTNIGLHTGQPSVNIPLFNLQGKGINVPISVVFNGGDITHESEASNIGLGWCLAAGGVITATIRDKNDMKTTSSKDNPWQYSGTYFMQGIKNNTDPDQTLSTLGNVLTGDSQPDIYNYAFLGYSGEICFDFDQNDKRRTTLYPDQKFKLTPTDNGYKIIADDGIEYYFEKQETNKIVAETYTTSWFLSEIKTKQGGDIIFSYESETAKNITNDSLSSQNYPLITTQRLTRIDFDYGHVEFIAATRNDIPGSKKITNIELYNDKNVFVKGYEFGNNDYISKNTIPASISWHNLRLKLNSISEYNYAKQYLPPYTFDYDYSFYRSKSSDYDASENYLLLRTRNTWAMNPTRLAVVDRMDNGDPACWLDPEVFMQNRLSNGFNAISENIDGSVYDHFCLTKISFPSGGSESYRYENHDYNYVSGATDDISGSSGCGYISGKRINQKNITDNSGKKQIVEYKYYLHDKEYKVITPSYPISSGQLIAPSIYTSVIYKPICTPSDHPRFQAIPFTSDKPQNSLSGPPVCYTEVEEIFKTYSGDTQGKNIYYFDKTVAVPATNYVYVNYYDNPTQRNRANILVTFQNILYGKLPSYPTEMSGYNTNMTYLAFPVGQFSIYDYMKGKVREEVTLNKQGNIVRKVENTYETLGAQALYGLIISQFNDNVEQSPLFNSYRYLISMTTHRFGTCQLQKSTTTNYFPDSGLATDSITQEQTFSYAGGNRLQSSTISLNSGDSLETDYVYPDGVTFNTTTGLSAQAATIKQMVDLNMINTPIQVTKKKGGKYVEGIYSTFKQLSSGAIAIDTIFNLKSQLETSIPNPVINASGKVERYSSFSAVKEYLAYDAYANPLTVKSKDEIAITYKWGYGGQYPISKIENYTQSQLDSNSALANQLGLLDGYTTITDANKASLISCNQAIRNSLPANTMITTYTYNPSIGMTSATDPLGVTTNYTYDTFNRLYLVRNDDQNIISQYRYGYQNANNNGMSSGYPNIVATVSTNIMNYGINDSGNATVIASGGSGGGCTYAWSLKNSDDKVLQSATTSSFSFTASQVGTLTVQCVVTDNVTGQIATNSSTVACYTVPIVTITTGDPVYLSQTTGTATVTASGGSGNYSYSWYFKASSGTILNSILNTASSLFSYTCWDVGTDTIQCVVTDNTTGKTVTASTTITCTSAAITGNFTFQSGYYSASTSISVSAPSVTFMLGFGTSSTMTVGTNYFVATVSQGCQPSATRTLTFYTAGRNWQITFNTDKSVYCQILSGSALPSGNGAYLGPITYSPW